MLIANEKWFLVYINDEELTVVLKDKSLLPKFENFTNVTETEDSYLIKIEGSKSHLELACQQIVGILFLTKYKAEFIQLETLNKRLNASKDQEIQRQDATIEYLQEKVIKLTEILGNDINNIRENISSLPQQNQQNHWQIDNSDSISIASIRQVYEQTKDKIEEKYNILLDEKQKQINDLKQHIKQQREHIQFLETRLSTLDQTLLINHNPEQ